MIFDDNAPTVITPILVTSGLDVIVSIAHMINLEIGDGVLPVSLSGEVLGFECDRCCSPIGVAEREAANAVLPFMEKGVVYTATVIEATETATSDYMRSVERIVKVEPIKPSGEKIASKEREKVDA